MRISKVTLNRGWVWATGLGVIAYAALTLLDMQLKSLTGVSTADLEGLSSAAQFRFAFHAWAPGTLCRPRRIPFGFRLSAMPLYALSFFFSGVIVAERFTPRRKSVSALGAAGGDGGAGGRAVGCGIEGGGTGDAFGRRR